MADPSGSINDVLVVEEYQELADLIAEFIELNGHSATVEHTGKAALDTFDASFDAVFLDRNLGRMRGEDVLNEIRSKSNSLPVVFVSSEVPDEDIFQHPIDDYLQKPVRPRKSNRPSIVSTTWNRSTGPNVNMFDYIAR